MKEILKNLVRAFASTFAFFAVCCICARLCAENKTNLPPFEYLDFSSAATFTLPDNPSEKERAVSASTGFQIKFKDLDLRFFRSLPKTEFSKIEECQNWKQRFELLDDFRYGGAVSLYQNSTPVVFKLGMNTFSRSISRLKNPAPAASANPLKKSMGFSSGIGISLPTLSSAAKPQSAAVSVELPLSRKFELDFQGFLTEEQNSGLSAQGKINFSRITFLEISTSLGRFYIENNSKILKKNYCEFEPDFFYAASFEASFKSPLLKSNFYSGIHENPLKENEYEDFPLLNFWIKSENRLAFKNLLLDFSYFVIPDSKNSPKAAPLISGSSSICRTVEQWSINPQILIPINDKNLSTLRLGFSFVDSWKITSEDTPEEYQSAKMKGGVIYENRLTAIKTEYSLENLIFGETPEKSSSLSEKFHGAKISFSSRAKKFNISASAACKIYFNDDFFSTEKQNYSFNLNISPKSKILSSSSSLSLTKEKKDEKTKTSGTFSSSCNIKFKANKKVRANCKIGISVPF